MELTPTRPADLVTLDREHLRELVAIARRGVRSEADADAVDRAQLVGRLVTAPPTPTTSRRAGSVW